MPDALTILRLPVEHQSNHFTKDTKDDVWLKAVGQKNWVVITHDAKFHLFQAEIAAVKQFSIRCFVLWGANAVRWEKMRCFVRAYDKILASVKTTNPPFIYKVSKTGQLTQVRIP